MAVTGLFGLVEGILEGRHEMEEEGRWGDKTFCPLAAVYIAISALVVKFR
jgi:hypothetical protein